MWKCSDVNRIYADEGYFVSILTQHLPCSSVQGLAQGEGAWIIWPIMPVVGAPISSPSLTPSTSCNNTVFHRRNIYIFLFNNKEKTAVDLKKVHIFLNWLFNQSSEYARFFPDLRIRIRTVRACLPAISYRLVPRKFHLKIPHYR
jgi:hypothetical protein